MKNGQSLIEILVAVAIAVIVVLGSIALIGPALRVRRDSQDIRAAAILGKELVDGIRVVAEADWSQIEALATSSVRYHMTTSTPFSFVSSSESVLVATTTYYRSFYIEDIQRTSVGAGDIAESGMFVDLANDPSGKKVYVQVTSTPAISLLYTFYIMRYRDVIFRQTDWISEGGFSGPYTAEEFPSGYYSAYSGVNVTSTPGAFYSTFGFGGGGK